MGRVTLTEAQRAVLVAMAAGGRLRNSGLDWWLADASGAVRRQTARALCGRGYVRMAQDGNGGPGVCYVITDAGRAALREQGDA